MGDQSPCLLIIEIALSRIFITSLLIVIMKMSKENVIKITNMLIPSIIEFCFW